MAISKEEKKELDRKAYFDAKKIREKWGLSDKPIKDLFSLVNSKEFLLLKFPNRSGISGVFIEKKGREKVYPCIYINSLEPNGRQNFTLAHELYHAFFEKSNDAVCLESKRSQDPIEYTAERFASHFLIPVETLREHLINLRINSNKWISFGKIVYLQSVFKVSFLAMVVAIENLKEYRGCSGLVPGNIKQFYKYKYQKWWKELEDKTLQFDASNDLNSSNPKFYMPADFKSNLINNFKNGSVEEDEVKDIFEFFNVELHSDKGGVECQ